MKFEWPVSAPVYLTRGFAYDSWLYAGGYDANGNYVKRHCANDVIPAGRPAYGEPIRAMENGVLRNPGGQPTYYDGYYVFIAHALGWATQYRHLRERSNIPDGTPVSKGQIIGFMDNTGVSEGSHLHYDVWNSRRLSAEAIQKQVLMGTVYAHDPQLWVGRELGATQEDWFDMATRQELHDVVGEWVRSPEFAGIIRGNVAEVSAEQLFKDDRNGAVYHYALGCKAHVISGEIFEAIGFDWSQVKSLSPAAVDAIPTLDQKIAAAVQGELKNGVRPKYGLSPTEKQVMVKVMALATNSPNAPALTLAETQSLISISNKLFGG